MLAWLLHLHGVWIGKAGVTRDPRTNPQVGTENGGIKDFLKTEATKTPYKFRDSILAMVHTDGRWLVKTSHNLMRQDLWMHHFPDAWWLLPERSFERIVASRERRGVSPRSSIVRTHLEMQQKLMGKANRWHMHSANRLCSGGDEGEDEARKIFEFVEIDFDPEVYHGWVQPGRWHG